jgi:hypothetical protein
MLCNVFIEFDMTIKLITLIKTCLNETYFKVRIGKNFSDALPFQIDETRIYFISTVFQFYFRIHHQEGMEVTGMNQLLTYADDVNILGEKMKNKFFRGW